MQPEPPSQQPYQQPFQQPYQAAPVQQPYQQQPPTGYQQPAVNPQGQPMPQGPAYQAPPPQPHYMQAQSSPAADMAKAARGRRNMIVGAIWFVLGIFITGITYASDSPVVVITWGAIIGGAIQFIVGLVQVSRSK